MAWKGPVVAILFAFYFVAGQGAAVLPSGSPGCDYGGRHYSPGQYFQPHVCENCFCHQSRGVACALTDCPYLTCADPVHDPTQCCPSCPNGPTCSYSGSIVKAGTVIKPDAHTTCTCFAPHMLCAHEMTTPRVHIDPAVG